MKSKLGRGEGKNGEIEVPGRMKDENRVSKQKCGSCGSTNLEENEDMVKCLDCGMGKYRAGRHKGC